MVFNFIRNIVVGHQDEKATLYKQYKLIGEVEIKIDDEKIEINTDEFDVTDIKEITRGSDHVKIRTKDAKYKIQGKQHERLYNMIHPLVKPEKTLFSSDDFTYNAYNLTTQVFERAALEEPVLKICEDHLSFYLLLEEADTLIHFQPINTSTQYYMDKNRQTFVWSLFKERKYQTFSVTFANNLDFLKFLTTFVECTYRSVNREGGDLKYYQDMFVNNDAPIAIDKEKSQPKEEVITEFRDEPKEMNEFTAKEEATNKHLIIDDRNVYVTRGKALGVFDTNLNFRTQVVNAFDNPSKIQTYNGHSSLLGQTTKESLGLLDLEKGEVVETWKLQEMNDFFNAKRDENSGTLVGIGDYNLFRIDPRTKEKIVETKEYKTKNEFSVGISTRSGDVAVASAKGDLRLYNTIGKRAKSLINGFGDKITGIDTSRNGSLVLCTCKSYILLYEVTSDYSKQLGKNKKSPIRLYLKPQHLSLFDSGVEFTPAKFDMNDKQIVSSTGKYLIRWLVCDILKNEVHRYTIRSFTDEVIDENFVMNGDDVIVALPNDVKKL